ncbi:MAG: hypothetical protein EPO08_06460 [Rhodospirillaceae bacterium]|nr:MAG: hypothetical protein EPO08_06460 [Rhodospirillaceae bacterium]
MSTISDLEIEVGRRLTDQLRTAKEKLTAAKIAASSVRIGQIYIRSVSKGRGADRKTVVERCQVTRFGTRCLPEMPIARLFRADGTLGIRETEINKWRNPPMTDDSPPATTDRWLDIAGAPRDGTEVYIEVGGRCRAYWDAELRTWVLSHPFNVESVSHPLRYLPLDQPHTSQGEVYEVREDCDDELAKRIAAKYGTPDTNIEDMAEGFREARERGWYDPEAVEARRLWLRHRRLNIPETQSSGKEFQEEINAICARHRGKVPGVANFRDRLWILIHPDGSEVAFTDYNQEITGHTDNAATFPVLGPHIVYGGNAYYIVGEANRLGFVTIDGGSNE